MIITEDESDAQHQIRAFTDHSITVNSTVYTDNLIITPSAIISPWELADIQQLMLCDLDPLIKPQADIILIGTGKNFIAIPPNMNAYFNEHKISFETMNTAAACRTYMALLAEGRTVTAALIIEKEPS